jgi:peptidyl-prolyl cis-trans isomerase B (cyclophilin B)
MSKRCRRGWILFATASLVLGCQRAEPTPTAKPAQDNVTAPVVPVQKPVENGLHMPFDKATLAEPPADAQVFCPPEKTSTGKSVGKMYEAIAGRNGRGGVWDQIDFVGAGGSLRQCTVTLQTELGDIVLELWPDLAPNHVRSFLALIKVGYFDGQVFYRAPRDTYKDEKGNDQRFESIEAGCPRGTGELGYGSIGYWLKPELHDPEITPRACHDAGTLGAWHDHVLETAACKFYITLTKAPWMDGYYTVFGKVTRGLDVARKILERPAVSTEEPDRPKEPVVIRSVIIHMSEVAAAGASK